MLLVPSLPNHEDAVAVDDVLRVLVAAALGIAREVEAGGIIVTKLGRMVLGTPTGATTTSISEQARARNGSAMARDSDPIRCAVVLERNLTRVSVRDDGFSQSVLNRLEIRSSASKMGNISRYMTQHAQQHSLLKKKTTWRYLLVCVWVSGCVIFLFFGGGGVSSIGWDFEGLCVYVRMHACTSAHCHNSAP